MFVVQKPVGSDSNEKTLLILAACAGFLLSFFVGTFSGNAFGNILLRALFFALVFTGIMYGILYLLSRLLEDTITQEAEQYPEETGETVNIVLPEESIMPQEVSMPASDDSVLSEDLEKEIELVKNEQLLETSAEQVQVNHGPIAKPLVTQDDLDVLPDIDSMSDVFADISEPDASHQENPPINYSSTTVNAPVYDKESPEIIARAVQTLLRQDGKGNS